MKNKASRVSHAPPSKASLREMPEQRFVPGKSRRNPYAARIREEGMTLQLGDEAPIVLREGAGRPKNGEGVGASRLHSVRVPDAMWSKIEARAKREGTTAHALLRAAVANLARAG